MFTLAWTLSVVCTCMYIVFTPVEALTMFTLAETLSVFTPAGILSVFTPIGILSDSHLQAH